MTLATISRAPATLPRTGRDARLAARGGDLKGQTSLAIYELVGDTLRICRAAPGKARPTEFASKPGSGLTLMSYQRAKPPAEKK